MHYASTAPAASLGDAAIVDIAQLLAQTTPAARKARSRRREPIPEAASRSVEEPLLRVVLLQGNDSPDRPPSNRSTQ
jgi:hypothetical protein